MTFKKEDELVLVVPRDKLFDNEKLTFQGSTSDSNVVDKIMDNIDKYYTSMRRGGVNETDVPKSKNAELNFDYKQPIPYIVIRQKGFYFVTERLSKGGESRLHGKLAMGVGGHMNPIGIDDCIRDDLYSFEKVLEINTRRELEEELSISQKDFEIKLIGLINDDSDTVGQVHIGVLGIIDLDLMTEVNVIETDQLAGQWISLYPLKHDHYEKLENWGKIVVDLLFNYESDR